MSDYERRPVPGFDGFEADTDGNVFSPFGRRVGSLVTAGRGAGHYYVTLPDGRKRRRYQLVALAFHGQAPSPRHEVAHRNDIHGDDRPENLYWATRIQNRADAIRNGKMPRGSENGQSKLNVCDVLWTRQMVELGRFSHCELANILGVARSRIWKIAKRKDWRHVPDEIERIRSDYANDVWTIADLAEIYGWSVSDVAAVVYGPHWRFADNLDCEGLPV